MLRELPQWQACKPVTREFHPHQWCPCSTSLTESLASCHISCAITHRCDPEPWTLHLRSALLTIQKLDSFSAACLRQLRFRERSSTLCRHNLAVIVPAHLPHGTCFRSIYASLNKRCTGEWDWYSCIYVTTARCKLSFGAALFVDAQFLLPQPQLGNHCVPKWVFLQHSMM